MEENLLLHILTGEATSMEKEVFYSQLANNSKEEELFYEVKSLWLRASLTKSAVDTDAEFENLWKRIKQKKERPSYSIGRRIIGYAAVILFVLGIGGTAGYFISENNFKYPDPGLQKYTAMRGSVTVIEFTDGTKVWLNSESKLTFHEDRQNKQRLAELSGEAYFEVKHRDDFPFVVKVGQLVVRDLGTTFNIKAYPEDNFIETSLVEGKADLQNINRETILALKPGESALYFPEGNKLELRNIANNVLSAWRDGKFVIRDQRLEDIFKELSRWYGVEFRFENQKLRDYRFTGNIKKSTTVLNVLKILQVTANFNYKIIEKIDKQDVVVIY